VLLVVDHVHLHYTHASQPTLSGLAFSLALGEQAILLGRSGSGKTSLLNLIAGLLLPSQGSISLQGQSWSALSERQRDRHRAQHIGYLPQQNHLLPSLNVWDNITLAAYCRDGTVSTTAKAQADATLQHLGIKQLAQRKVASLSGGEAQRVALARALVNQPALLLADEPTANLDDDNCALVCELLQANAAQRSLLIATHDARVIAALPGAKVIRC
jgi:putative ABC transport system ATP-binding protein